MQRQVRSAVADFNLVINTVSPNLTENLEISTVDETLYSSQAEVDRFEVESDSASSVKSVSSVNSTSTEIDCESVTDLSDKLRSWTISHNITASATSDLLKLLHGHHCFKYLPLDSRTLLHTPRATAVINVPPGQYCAFDWVASIRKIIMQRDLRNTRVEIQINIDGIPLYHGSSQQFWPILGAINDDVFVIGIYSGQQKPNSLDDFFSPFLQQLDEAPRQLLINGVEYKIKLSDLICDAPARAFVLGIKCHAGYSSCGNCTIKGVYYKNRVIFPYGNHPERTDASFRARLDPQHHHEATFIEKTDLDLVRDSPGEYMHLVCLGIVRKILFLLTKGKKCPARLRPHQIEEISNELLKLKRSIPCEFARKPRKLKDLEYWKATEFRQFILYTGPLVLKNIISNDLYEHFMSLHVAISILADKVLHITHNNYANELLNYFVKHFGTLYGEENMSFNVHGLLHLASDCINHGQLDKFSAFKFENKLQEIKNLVRSTNCPLQQAHRRLIERENQILPAASTPFVPCLNSPWSYSNPPAYFANCSEFYKKFQNTLFKLSVLSADRACEILNGDIVIIKTFLKKDGKELFVGRQFIDRTNFYSTPCPSSVLNIYLLSKPGPIKCFNTSQIVKKVILLPCGTKYLAAPLIHLSA